MPRYAHLLLLTATLVTPTASAQTVRFTTTVGSFDMVLNPSGDANLEPLVDNMLANIAAGVYHNNLINRADPGFVLQLGGFSTDTRSTEDISAESFPGVDQFDDVVVDANLDGSVDFSAISNEPGTVSLALAAGDVNSGSSSFFVNISDNTGSLDPQGFVPFALVPDTTVVDAIMAAPRIDISGDVGQPGSLAFINVPLAPDGDLIIVESVAVVSDDPISFADPLFSALGIEPPTPTVVDEEVSLALLSTDPPPLITPGFVEEQPQSVSGVPEPGTAALLTLAAATAAVRRRRRGAALPR